MKKIAYFFVAAGLALGLTSCLNDDEHFVNFAGAGYVAEIPYTANRSIAKAVTVSAAAASVVAPVDINIASPNPPTQNIDVTVGVDQAALTTYNVGRATPYKILPAAAYQLTTPMVTVTAGQRIATVNVTFVGTQVPATGGPYALPLTIQSASNNAIISANNKTQILTVTLAK
ncbi:DUF1735 domain-containing protein [Spirosoma utsteinense]|uniref:BT-3987-like N-terminal domain-containing protein n=1 Tax=Spirosoma utsteinense TaxID=2585773 RepID=A0ABR6WAC7_9BACT|nr:DUF1735 domain-containing protein [Spirosoma utsteinense]MBC3784054.1 hypothetical protein [Spirosoma utsteinense]MBC3793457.1 hypothetical protein [Spirosoma utsteinense]